MEPTEKFKIERLDEKTARKTDQTESVTILNVDFLRTQKEELLEEVQVKQKILTEVSEIIESEKKSGLLRKTVEKIQSNDYYRRQHYA